MSTLFKTRTLMALLFTASVILAQFAPTYATAEEATRDPATLIKALEPLRSAVSEFRRLNNTWPTQEWAQGELKKTLASREMAPETVLVEDFWTDDTTFFMNLLDPDSGKNLVMTGTSEGVTLEAR